MRKNAHGADSISKQAPQVFLRRQGRAQLGDLGANLREGVKVAEGLPQEQVHRDTLDRPWLRRRNVRLIARPARFAHLVHVLRMTCRTDTRLPVFAVGPSAESATTSKTGSPKPNAKDDSAKSKARPPATEEKIAQIEAQQEEKQSPVVLGLPSLSRLTARSSEAPSRVTPPADRRAFYRKS